MIMQCLIKYQLPVLSTFLKIESPLKVMKNAFYLTLKLFSFFKYLNLADVFGYAGKRLDIKKVKVSFKIYEGIYWETNYYNTHITQYLKT